MRNIWDYTKRNPMLLAGFVILLGLLLFTTVGHFFINPEKFYTPTMELNRPPSAKHPFGTDAQGRDLLTGMVMGTGMTLEIGAIAGGIGLGAGIVLGFVAGYAGGIIDALITSFIDVWLTIPSFLILILISSMFKNSDISVTAMGLIVSIVSWAGPARSIRAQVLSMRERPFVMMAKLSGMSTFDIILK